MDTIAIILTVISLVIFFTSAALTFIIKHLKDGKVKNALVQLNSYLDTVNKYVGQAENLVGLTGGQKKEFVTNKVKEFAQSNKLPVSDEVLSKLIEKTVGDNNWRAHKEKQNASQKGE